MTDREAKLIWLNRGRTIRTKLIGLYAERQERMARAEYAGISYGISGQHSGNATERKILSVAEIEDEIRVTERELAQAESEIRQAIAEVHRPIYQTYLRMRFLGYKSERQIADETHYSVRYIQNHIRKESLDCVKMFPNVS